MDVGEQAHLQQRHQALKHEIETKEQALKDAKADTGGATQTLQNQLQALKAELGQIQAQMKAGGVPEDPEETQRELGVKQAHEETNVTTSSVEENKRQEEEARRNTQRGGPQADQGQRTQGGKSGASKTD